MRLATWLTKASLLAVVCVASAGQPLQAGKIYWTQPGFQSAEIWRADQDGANVELILSGIHAMEIAIAGDKLYWGDGSTIWRADPDGSDVEPLFVAGPTTGIALDVAAGKIYWASGLYAAGRIQRANLDGSESEVVVDQPNEKFFDIALDIAGGKIYSTGWGIYRVDIDGSNFELLPVQADVPWGITLDLEQGNIYWAEPDWCIRFATLDGSISGCLTDSNPAVGVAWDVALKPLPHWSLYWSNAWGGTGIWRLGPGGYHNVVPGVAGYRVAFYDDGLDVCGNGVVEAGEECDDGNDVAGDGCEPNCIESPAQVPALSIGASIVAVLLLLAASTAVVAHRDAPEADSGG